jgi:pimeloyl-ACP methyl ester carboxylesterase
MQNPPFTSAFAEVRAHDQVMRYHRTGAGRPIVVLRVASDESLWPELDQCLACAFRVLTPEVPDTSTGIARWLGGFLEGVGLDRITLVASDGFCLPALELVLLGADQVERLVLVPAGPAVESTLDGTLATSLEGGAVPLLVIRRGLPAAEALPLLMQFLTGGSATKTAG